MEIINFKNKNTKPVTKEQQKSYQNAKFCYIFKEKIEDKHTKNIKHREASDHCHFTREYEDAAYSICNLKYNMSKEIPIQNRSNHNYHFIIKELAEKFEEQFTCLGGNI